MIKNPPAFPQPNTQGLCEGGDGMSLRDYFAAQSLGKLNLMINTDGVTATDYDSVAKYAYSMADAMLAERSKL